MKRRAKKGRMIIALLILCALSTSAALLSSALISADDAPVQNQLDATDNAAASSGTRTVRQIPDGSLRSGWNKGTVS